MTLADAAKIAQAKALRNEGLTTYQVAERLGVSQHTICRWTVPGQCETEAIYASKYRAENRGKIVVAQSKERKANRAKYRLQEQEFAKKYPIRNWAGAATSRAKGFAKKKNIPFALTMALVEAAYLKTGGRCPALGIPLQFGPRKIVDGSPTLDRLNPLLGYVPNNIQVLSHKANRIKSDATASEIQAVATWLQSQTT